MEADLATHPSVDALRAFCRGTLDDASAEGVLSHLEGCQECRGQVESLTGGDFLDRLRLAIVPGDTPAPGKSISETARNLQRTFTAPATPLPIMDLPRELAESTQYEMVRELGRGGMGVVYLAKNKWMGRYEVLKVVNQQTLDRSGGNERFLREIQSASMLNHPNVVTAYSVVLIGELLVFAMEYIDGQDLAKLVKDRGPLPVQQACYYAQQAALGLQHAFEKKMVHRDIKPQNLIACHDGKKHIVKVLDFGLAKVLPNENRELTGTGQLLGTPDYIAPEQILDAASADIRADIYSLGCTLYYLLSSEPPFKRKSLYEVFQAHQLMEAKPLNLVRDDVPHELAAVVRKMMAKEPAQRYQTPFEVAQALTPFIRPEVKSTSTKLSHLPSPGAAPVQSASPLKLENVLPIAPEAAGSGKTEKPSAMDQGKALAKDTLTGAVVTSTELQARGGPRKRRSRRAKSPAKKNWLIAIAVAACAIFLLVALWLGGVINVKRENGLQPQTGDDRCLWRFSPTVGDGYFKLLDDGTWLEVGDNRHVQGTWRELTRTPEYVELHDQQRNMTGRLTAQGEWLRDGPAGAFRLYYRGGWAKANSGSPISKPMQMVFLSDLNEWQVVNAIGFVKNCNRLVNRRPTPHGLLLHPPDNGFAAVIYRINKSYQRFKTTVGVSDEANGGAGSESALTFKVLGDNKLLWQSKPVQRLGDSDSCEIPVETIAELRLQVDCPGSKTCAHAVWCEPHLLRN